MIRTSLYNAYTTNGTFYQDFSEASSLLIVVSGLWTNTCHQSPQPASKGLITVNMRLNVYISKSN